MTKRLEYLHVCRFLVVCQGSLRIWAYHIQAVKLNGKSIDQDNLWNKYSQPSQYEAACSNAPVSTFQDAVLTSRHDTESIYHGPEPLWRAFQWFWWIGSLQYDEFIISQFRSWHQQTTIPKRKSRKFVFPSIHGLLMFAWYVEGSSFCTWRLLSQFFPEFSDIYVISLAYMGGIEYWSPLCFLVFFGWPVACCLLTFETCGKPPAPEAEPSTVELETANSMLERTWGAAFGRVSLRTKQFRIDSFWVDIAQPKECCCGHEVTALNPKCDPKRRCKTGRKLRLSDHAVRGRMCHNI